MSSLRRLLPLVVLLVLAVALPALAADEQTETTAETTETTVASEGGTETTVASESSGQVPPQAVTVPPTAAEEETPDWTYRYLIPTLIALAVLVVIITTVQYFLRVVRNRYKVVE